MSSGYVKIFDFYDLMSSGYIKNCDFYVFCIFNLPIEAGPQRAIEAGPQRVKEETLRVVLLSLQYPTRFGCDFLFFEIFH